MELGRGRNVSGQFYLEGMIIDCDSCVMREIACKDCVVSVLISSPAKQNQVSAQVQAETLSEMSLEEARVIDLLASRGMVPPLRYAQTAGFEGNSQESQALSG